MEPCGTPNKNSQYLLYASLVFVLLRGSFAIYAESCCRNHKQQVIYSLIYRYTALERPVNKVPLTPPLSRHCLHFSTITKRQCCTP